MAHFFKKMRLLIILTIWTSVTLGQGVKQTSNCEKVIDSLTNKEIYNYVDIQAKIIGGMSTLYSELGKIKMPKNSETNQINILMTFIVESNGEITGLRTNINDTTLDNELLRCLKQFKWEPGTCKGIKVPSKLMLTIKS